MFKMFKGAAKSEPTMRVVGTIIGAAVTAVPLYISTISNKKEDTNANQAGPSKDDTSSTPDDITSCGAFQP